MNRKKLNGQLLIGQWLKSDFYLHISLACFNFLQRSNCIRMRDSDYNIVVCTNSSYAKYIPVLFNSISFHTKAGIAFYVVYSSITEDQKSRIKDNISINPENTVEFIEFDTENELRKLEKDKKFTPFAGSFDAYTRLFLTEILYTRRNVSRVLYLDIDIVANKSLEPIFASLKTEKLLGGVLDSDAEYMSDMKEHYINSGVLLLNLKALHEFGFMQKALDLAAERAGELAYFDQDIINMILGGDQKTLYDVSFNTQSNSPDEIEKGILFHFTGARKPWKRTLRWRVKKCMWVKHWIMSRVGGGVIAERVLNAFLLTFRPFLNIF